MKNSFFDHFFSVRYGNIIVHLYHENMKTMRDCLNRLHVYKTLKSFLEYCYYVDVKVLLQALDGEKRKGLRRRRGSSGSMISG